MRKWTYVRYEKKKILTKQAIRWQQKVAKVENVIHYSDKQNNGKTFYKPCSPK